jgi:hypothetical protein
MPKQTHSKMLATRRRKQREAKLAAREAKAAGNAPQVGAQQAAKGTTTKRTSKAGA